MSAQTETLLYNFSDGSDGGHPASRLVFDAEGNLYGTTRVGGLGFGTVYELSPNGSGGWTETVLHSFAGGFDGSDPRYSDVVFDGAGNLYGTTHSGGAKNHGVVFKLTHSGSGWTETILHSFGGSKTEGCYPGSGLIMDSAGKLYGTTHGCGGTNGTVFEMSSSGGNTWTEHIIYGVKTSYAGLTMDGAGNIFGTSRDNLLYELSPNGNGGWTASVLHAFTGTPFDGSDPQGALVFDSSGDLYGTTLHGGTTGRGTVYRMSHGPSGWSEQLLYSFQCCKGHIYSPFGGVVLDPAGNIYGTATLGSGYGGIFKLTPSGGSYTESNVFIFHPLEGWDSQASMIRDGAGNLYGTVMFTASGAGGVFQLVP
jgi:uncharacterized repeat protein (TIGR03803 family)